MRLRRIPLAVQLRANKHTEVIHLPTLIMRRQMALRLLSPLDTPHQYDHQRRR